jgi:threonine dehydratase
MAVTIEDIHAAAAAISGSVLDTPCLHSRTLSAITGAAVIIKFENLQFTASFKERGALVKLLSLTTNQRAQGVIAASAGNHAQGVAHHAQRLGIPAVIVMPRHTPHVKIESTRTFGAEIVLEGENFDAAYTVARRLMQERGLHFIHPYDDEKVIAGQGTIALEMLAARPDLDVLIVPVGGGGLIAGIAVAAKSLKPDIEIIGVQTTRFPSMHSALKGTQAQFGTNTIAEGIAVKEPGRLTLPIVRELVDDVLLVDEGDIEQGIVMLLEIEKTVAEGAGAAGLAALIRYPARFSGRKVGLVLCGGNIDPLMLVSIIERGMARSGRLVRLSVEIRDVPGMLAQVTACLARANANIEEVYHQRTFTNLSAQAAELEFVVQTRGHRHAAEIIEALCKDGFQARLRHPA